MIQVTPSVIQKLRSLIDTHPEDPIVRLTIRDLNDHRLVISITLVDKLQPEDEVQDCEGITIAVAGNCARRMEGVTMDYRQPLGFKFEHPEPKEGDNRPAINLN